METPTPMKSSQDSKSRPVIMSDEHEAALEGITGIGEVMLELDETDREFLN